MAAEVSFCYTIYKIVSCITCIPFTAKILHLSNHQATVFMYLVIFYLYYGIAIGLFYSIAPLVLSPFKSFIDCPKETEDQENDCLKASIIYRTSASLLIFSSALCLLMLFRDNFAYRINKHCWLFKFILPGLLLVGFMFIPNFFMEWFVFISKFGGLAYLVVQDISFLLLFGYLTRYFLIKMSANCLYGILVLLVFIISVCATSGIIFSNFILFWDTGEDCSHNKILFFVHCGGVATLFLFSLLQLLVTRRIKSYTNVASVSLYSVYIGYYFISGMASNSSKSCSTVYDDWRYVAGEIAIGITICTLMFLGLSLCDNIPLFKAKDIREFNEKKKYYGGPGNLNSTDRSIKYRMEMNKGGKEGQKARDRLEYRTWKYFWFFLCLALLSIYFMNIVNNWGTIDHGSGEWHHKIENMGYYVKLGNAAIAFAFQIIAIIYNTCVPLSRRDADEHVTHAKNEYGNNQNNDLSEYK